MRRLLSVILLIAIIVGTINIFSISISADSSTRMIETFYNTAFDATEKKVLDPVTITCDDYTEKYITGNQYISDKVYLPEFSYMINPDNGYSSEYYEYDTARLKYGTDYAKC